MVIHVLHVSLFASHSLRSQMSYIRLWIFTWSTESKVPQTLCVCVCVCVHMKLCTQATEVNGQKAFNQLEYMIVVSSKISFLVLEKN